LICGNEYANAVPIFRSLLPLIILTLPIYLLGYPVLGAMNMMRQANLSVIYASLFHLSGLITLWMAGFLNFTYVSWLTCITEGIVLIFRVKYVLQGRRKLKIESMDKK
jgi:PST family polysaccharide transporter